jgi:hypothetical protein
MRAGDADDPPADAFKRGQDAPRLGRGPKRSRRDGKLQEVGGGVHFAVLDA